MENRFLFCYNSQSTPKKSAIDKTNFLKYINNYKDSNFLASNYLNKLDLDIQKNKSYERTLNTDRICKNKNLSRNKDDNTANINSIIYKDKHFVREFEDLFHEITNKKVGEYYYNRPIKNINNFLQGIQNFNYIDFMKKIKRKKSKNKKPQNQNQIRQRNYSSLPSYNYIPNSYFASYYGNCQNEKDNKSSNLSTDENSLENFSYDLNKYNCSVLNSEKKERNPNYDDKAKNKNYRTCCNSPNSYRNVINKVDLFRDEIKFRNFSINSKENRNSIDKCLYKYKSKKSFNFI
jgi:hypothetical protein